LVAIAIIGGSFTRPKRFDVPDERANVGVKSVDRVVLGSDNEKIVRATARNGDSGEIQRFGIHQAVDGEDK
jgi:hypothetical protein